MPALWASTNWKMIQNSSLLAITRPQEQAARIRRRNLLYVDSKPEKNCKPEFEIPPHPFLHFIYFHDPFFDLAGFYRDLLEKIHIPFCDLSHAGFWGLEELRIVDDAAFYNLCEFTFEFLLRQSLQKGEINKSCLRRVEVSPEVFPRWQIKDRLPSDAAVHLHQERGWNLNLRDAAHVCGSDEDDNIAHTPPPSAIRAEVRSAPIAMSFSITSRPA